jgi:uncharacterized DUF497 family protein
MVPQISVTDFEYSERADSKMWEHGIEFGQLYEVLDHRHVVKRNRKGRVAEYFLIGRDNNGRCIAIPIVGTDDPYVWRPITAWYCKPSEAAKLR